MISGFITLCTFWAAGAAQSVLITQWPRFISSLPSALAEMHCYQNNTEYDYLYWYRQQKEAAPQLIVSIVGSSETFEADFKSGFQAVRSEKKRWSLKIPSIQRKDEAVYLCAAIVRCVNYEAYFGQGTKLTVLEPDHDVTPPTVQVFKPSEKECKVKTLVCVASGFYPDHVSVSWEVDGVTETDSVATDNTALREGKHYSLSSRLTVQSKTWFKPSRTFTCRVSFFNGTDTIDVEDSITGETDSGGMPNDTKMKIMQNAKLTYSVLIAKSFIYGVFIMFLVWKLKGLSGKQSSRERSCGLNN
ncbi:M1-specific T cell receptor beta chain-like isoform X21 [Genypterus blacodes]|uniref:M1-specific T cell receptor beta chain-like isoform X21 n=1 Tax=Genypterus blacodes TaxID=154954 RepID=UPI003F75EAC6